MVIRGIFKFYGSKVNEDRMPQPYHVYMVYSSPHPYISDYSIVSIMISLNNPPMPSVKEFAIKKDPKGAIEDVFSIIASLKENKELHSIKSLEEVKESLR
jgi:hypothetical protein